MVTSYAVKQSLWNPRTLLFVGRGDCKTSWPCHALLEVDQLPDIYWQDSRLKSSVLQNWQGQSSSQVIMKLIQTVVLTWWFDICLPPAWILWMTNLYTGQNEQCTKMTMAQFHFIKLILVSAYSFMFVWDSWIPHLYVGGRYTYLPLSLCFPVKYFYNNNGFPWHHSDSNIGHFPFYFPSQWDQLLSTHGQDTIVTIPETCGKAKALLGQ